MHKLIMALVVASAAVGLTLGVSGASAGPINNDCSGGYVSFTFDDGPDPTGTPAIIQALQNNNMTATFFVVGQRIGDPGGVALIQSEVADGYTIGNHTWDHASFTGVSTATAPLTDQQVTDELNNTSNALVAAGAPYPTLYRPPYGDIDSYYDLLARNLGYRIVMPWGTNIADSRDWTGISAAQIANNVINGYTDQFGKFQPGIKADSIVSMHDGDPVTAIQTANALPTIATYMNTKHLCSGPVRPDATGGVVPAPAPAEPVSGNLVVNPSLEQTRPVTQNITEPVCFQQAGASTASNTAVWALTNDAHSGSNAMRVDVSRWSGGDRKLVLTQRESEKSCLAAVTPGKSYSFWVYYKGSWAHTGSTASKVSIATYYKNSAGAWVYWQGGPLMPPTGSWNLAYFTSAALPAGATAVSYGLAIQGAGSLITDDYAMVQN